MKKVVLLCILIGILMPILVAEVNSNDFFSDIETLFDEESESTDSGEGTDTAIDTDEFFTGDEFVIEDSEPDESDESVDINDILQNDVPIFKGNLNLKIGASGGLVDFSDEEIRWFHGAESDSLLSVDIQPFSYLRFFGQIGVLLNETTLEFSAPDIRQFYVDYTVAETVFIRSGFTTTTWGNGRMFNNPGNLAKETEDAFSLKFSFPVFSSTFTGLIYSNAEYQKNDTAQKAAYAFLFESVINDISLGASAAYRYKKPNPEAVPPFDASMYVKTAIAGIDFTAEGVAHMDFDESLSYLGSTFEGILNAFYENTDMGVKFYSEFEFGFDAFAFYDRIVGFGLSLSKVKFGPLSPRLLASHHIDDLSGQVIIGLKGEIVPKVYLEIGLPVTYGRDGTYFITENEDPLKRRIALAVALDLKYTF